MKSCLMTRAQNLRSRTLRLLMVSTVIHHAVNVLLPRFCSDITLICFFCVWSSHSHPWPCLPWLVLFSIWLVLAFWKGNLLGVTIVVKAQTMRKGFFCSDRCGCLLLWDPLTVFQGCVWRGRFMTFNILSLLQ